MRHTVLRFFPLGILFIGLAVGYGLSKIATPEPPPVIEPLVPVATSTAPEAGRPAEAAVASNDITINLESLPEGQQELLRGLGITGSVTFTGAQVACAEAALGEARVAEIAAGSLPGPIELTKLIGCR